MAAEFADEEAEHVTALEKWIAQTPRPAMAWDADPGPLHTVT